MTFIPLFFLPYFSNSFNLKMCVAEGYHLLPMVKYALHSGEIII